MLTLLVRCPTKQNENWTKHEISLFSKRKKWKWKIPRVWYTEFMRALKPFCGDRGRDREDIIDSTGSLFVFPNSECVQAGLQSNIVILKYCSFLHYCGKVPTAKGDWRKCSSLSRMLTATDLLVTEFDVLDVSWSCLMGRLWVWRVVNMHENIKNHL